jgi:hypothetical protein
MTKYSAGAPRVAPPPRTPSLEGLLLPTQRDRAALCELYAPGHQMHYRHQEEARHTASVAVRDTLVDGTRVTLTLEEDRELEWRHHDPERLVRVLEVLRSTCRAHLDQHALRVGPYWFNCATGSHLWQDCPVSRAAAHRA